ncbi:hypothetical protein N800_00690 [Lysobacter daejeonensis GH1-9]|uniref:Lipoprotein n=1 Tax=Lysobacter daejeonensis GH1-9 TaxID=1385517 RepID=A0A0A0ESL3_9GAMM|nr:hypothetical protein [Lysobacter daejeonensis]KGM53489.1 hypothetical protein N800_00690 [Lysobacter daejeonensis GH1-9]
MKTRSAFLGVVTTLALSLACNSALAWDGDNGCTPGYWKQEQHFDSWPFPYEPNTLLRDVFVTAPPEYVPDDTFLEALNYGGGPGVEGATQILLRAAVAALLNAEALGLAFEDEPAEIINSTVDRLESQWRPTILTRATYFDSINNGPDGCPLN